MAVDLTHEQLDALKRIDSPTIANAIETFKVRPRVAGYVGMDIKCIYPELPPMVGYAITCTVDSTTEGRVGIGFNELYKILQDAPKPAVVVMKDVGNDILHSCHAGEVMSTTSGEPSARLCRQSPACTRPGGTVRRWCVTASRSSAGRRSRIDRRRNSARV